MKRKHCVRYSALTIGKQNPSYRQTVLHKRLVYSYATKAQKKICLQPLKENWCKSNLKILVYPETSQYPRKDYQEDKRKFFGCFISPLFKMDLRRIQTATQYLKILIDHLTKKIVASLNSLGNSE